MTTTEAASHATSPPVDPSSDTMRALTGRAARRPSDEALADVNRNERSRRSREGRRVAALICVIGLLLTCVFAWAAARVDHSTEKRLLDIQTKQAATVLSTAILLIKAPLSTALSVQSMVGPDDTSAFARFMAASVGPDKTFMSASMWHRDRGRLTRVSQVGSSPALAPGDAATERYLRRAFDQSTFTVRTVTVGSERRIAYALADKSSDLVVYAERAIPADRRAPVDRNSAFSELDYAIYFGPRTDAASLSTTDVDPSTLPLHGTTARATVPFGDTDLTLVTSARHHLGGSLSQRLPLMLLIGGFLLTAVAARTGQQLVRRRQDAEENTSTITALYERVGTLYGHQRELSVKLQRALLPHANPDIPHLETAAEYVAGAQGVDIGGDWYSIIGLDDERFAFVVGDVSGRGIDAVAVMARARFTLRAYLMQGDSPVEALDKCSHQFDIAVDGHITTAVVGVGNARTGEVTVASAGHPAPLLLSGTDSSFVDVCPGPPLGTGPSTYTATTFTMSPGATLLCYTDGLIERRTESIDVGMRRLATTVAASAGEAVGAIVATAVASMRTDDAPDDIAVLAVRWVPVP